MHPRLKQALLFAVGGAVVGIAIGSTRNSVLGIFGSALLGAAGAFIAGLFWE